jgi:phospholipid transport system substrate-binding protein
MGVILRLDLWRCQAPRALAAFALALVMAAGAARGEGPATAEAAATFLGAFRDQGATVQGDASLDPGARRAAVRRLLAESCDLPAISRFVLGKYWRRASDEERTEFRLLFEDYVVAALARRLDDFSGEDATVAQVRLERPGLALVSSRFPRNDGKPVAVDWRLRHGKAGWRIIDIVVEGVSLVLAQRAEFTSIVRNDGGRMDAVLSRLRRAVERDHSLAAFRLADSG